MDFIKIAQTAKAASLEIADVEIAVRPLSSGSYRRDNNDCKAYRNVCNS